MNTQRMTRRLLSASIAALLVAGSLHAQDAAPAQATPPPAAQGQAPSANSKNATNLDQVVVTGNAANGGLKKIDTSYSITTATLDQIREFNAKSSADLLKMAPGVFPESSGGQTGANIEVAGFPGGGDAPFVTFQLNGSPIYPMPTLSFMENSSMFRLDDTIDHAELVLGGPAVLYGNGQPGLTANFILREGTDKPSGDVGVTYGSEGMVRLDGFLGFKIADNWYGSIGGFWRKSDGVRDPEFSADKGGQLTATLTRNFDNGSLVLYARDLKDHNQFVTDTPILNPSRGQFDAYPGFDPLTGTFGSKANQYSFIQTTPCYTAGCTPGGQDVNLAKGRGADIFSTGGNLDLDFGDGWSISDKFNFTGGQMNTIAFFSTGANPQSLSSYIADAIASNGLPADTTANATYTSNGQAADMNQNVTTQGLWYVHKRIQGASNEFHLNKEIFDGNTLTFGNYTAVYNDHDTWYLGNNMLLQAKNNPSPIAVTLSNGDVLSSSQGFVSGPSTAIREAWNGFNTAFFLTDTWKLDQWLFDAGVRVERQEANGRIQNTATGDLDDNPATLYNNNSQYLVGGNSYINYAKTAPSWTIGANYEIQHNMSVYARVNDGVHFPGFDDLRGLPTQPVNKIHNMEVGFKYQADWVYLDVNAYRKLFYNVPYTITMGNGQQFSFDYGSATKGINFTTVVKPFEHFSIALSGDYMDGHYTHSAACTPYTAQDGSEQCASLDGMQLQRQPKFQGRLTPAYDFPTAFGSMKLWVTYEYIGNRYGDLIEQQPLGQYHTLAFGATANIGQNWQVNLQGTNMTNEIGITEGNSRLFGFASEGGVILARSIEGREVNLQVKYNF
ncbi:TonB-dependent receptor [Dyella sp. C9]|uniref:TonB-dependent receptor n=1 Tax=Dyella sp. C9 TaxID=2202154 RepID=UPI000DEF141B|nr:TonB-dependent receptor [Dyella sp. C9]